MTTRTALSPGPFPCYFQCGRWLQNKFTREAERWLWFTGYGESPVHFCSECQRTRAADIALIREQLNQRPQDYPRERAQIKGKP